MLTKEERQEVIDKGFYYISLGIKEFKKLEREQKPKRVSKYQAASNHALAKRREQRLKK